VAVVWRSAFVSINEANPRRARLVGDRVRVHFPVLNIYLSMYITSHPGQLSLAILSWVGAMSTGSRAVTPCGWEVKAGMVHVWVAGKTVIPLLHACHI